MTQVSWVKNLVLAILLFFVASLAYWLQYKHKPEEDSAEQSSKKLFVLKDTQIESIRLSDGVRDFEWDCLDLATKGCKPGDNSKWKITLPMQARADDSSVNSFVSALGNLVSSDVIDLKDETPASRAQIIKDYGLAPGARSNPGLVRRIAVKTAAGTTVAYFGDTHPINQSYFTIVKKDPPGEKPTGKADESRVYLVPSYFKANFNHDLTYWRDKKLLSFMAAEIGSFELDSHKNGRISAERKNGGWVLNTKDGIYDGDIENVDTLLSSAAYLTAKNFVSDHKTDEKAKAALKGARELLTLRFQPLNTTRGASAKSAPEPVTLVLYKKEPKGKKGVLQIFASVSNEDPLYELQPVAERQLDKDLKDLRLSKLITSLDRFTAKRLEFSGKPMGAQPLTLVSENTRWVTLPGRVELSNEKVQSTLDRLSGNRIREFLSGKEIPPGEQDGLKFSLGDDKTPLKRQLIFWKKDGKLYARDLASARKEAFLVDSSVIDGLPWDRSYFNKTKK